MKTQCLEVTKWIKEHKQAYNCLKSLPLNQLQNLGKISGLDMNHYNTKSMITKGLLIKIAMTLPNEVLEYR